MLFFFFSQLPGASTCFAGRCKNLEAQKCGSEIRLQRHHGVSQHAQAFFHLSMVTSRQQPLLCRWSAPIESDSRLLDETGLSAIRKNALHGIEVVPPSYPEPAHATLRRPYVASPDGAPFYCETLTFQGCEKGSPHCGHMADV